MICTGPVVGYREFVDGICRAVFEDTAGQFVLADDERIYGLFLTPEVDSSWPAILNRRPDRISDKK
jgi:hypothetical protein